MAVLALAALSARAAEISVADVQGVMHRPLADAGQAATVVFFVMHDCPIANAYAPEISRIADEYKARGVRCYVLYAESDLASADARKHAADYAFRCPVLLDPKFALVRAAGATVTPEAAVFSAKGRLLYRGRIDDRAIALGRHRAEPQQRDLRDALDAILAGKPVRERFTKAIGCYISQPAEIPAPAKASPLP